MKLLCCSDIPKVKYPKSVFFIVTNEFCERFCNYGLRAVLVLYLNLKLHYSEDDATVIFHAFNSMCFFFPLFGAIIADSWLGKYRTIVYMSLIYALGNLILSVTAVRILGLPQSALTILGLILIAVGTGGIKPCVSAFGGDQFVLPQQELALQRFFSFFYFSINAGSLLSTFITPILREDVQCLGEQSCYPLAFGLSGALMVVSLLIFLAGTQYYERKPPEGNIVHKVSKCIWHAWRRKDVQREHWLDKADDKYDRKFIEEVKVALNVLVLFAPLPVFWALYDQQSSRWTFQATRMKGDQGVWSVKPDQMQVFNPVLILVFIPLFEAVVYPIFAKCNLLKLPLQKQVIGGLLASVAFIVSAIVEFKLESTYPVLPKQGEGQLRIYNNIGCDIRLSMDAFDPILIKNLDMWENKSIPISGISKSIPARWESCAGESNGDIEIYNNAATSYTFLGLDQPFKSRNEQLEKSENGDPTVMVSFSTEQPETSWKVEITFEVKGETKLKVNLDSEHPIKQFQKVSESENYEIKVNGKEAGRAKLTFGGGYVIMIHEYVNGGFSLNRLTLNEPNSLNILWLIPQYVLMTAAEIMFSIPGLEFAFTQASPAMKSLLTAAWLLTTAFGNAIVIIVAEAKLFKSQAYEFLLFAGLMLVDMLIFQLMAKHYKYVDQKKTAPVAEEISEPNGVSSPVEEKE